MCALPNVSRETFAEHSFFFKRNVKSVVKVTAMLYNV